MALSDKPTRAVLRTSAQREVMDTAARWWTAAEFNGYLDDWLDEVQSQLELIWGSATATVTGSATLTFTAFATDILRLDAVYWDDKRLVYRTKDLLEQEDRNWRDLSTGTPKIFYQDTFDSLSFSPPPGTAAKTVVLEYPRVLSFAADTSTLELPAWTKHGARAFCASRAYGREGPNHDGPRSARYRALFDDKMRRFKLTMSAYFPKRSIALRPGGDYEKDLRNSAASPLTKSI